MRKQSFIYFYFLFLQTEEDYIPYPSVHEVGWWALFTDCILVLEWLSYLPRSVSHNSSRVRGWAEKAPFLSSSCRSLGVTGSKGQTTIWVKRWTRNSCSLCPRTPAPNWNVTRWQQSTENTSWARLVPLDNTEWDAFLNVYTIFDPFCCHHIKLKKTIFGIMTELKKTFMKTQILNPFPLYSFFIFVTSLLT